MQCRTWTAALTSLSLLVSFSNLGCDEEKSKAKVEKEQAARAADEKADAEEQKGAQAPEKNKKAKGAPKSLDDFEGQIDLELDPGQGEKLYVVPLQVKDGQLRIDLPTETGGRSPGYQLVDLEDGNMTSVVHQQKVAIELNLEQMKEQFASLVPSGEQEADASFEKTDKTDEVAGYECQEWLVEPPNAPKQRICVADIGAQWFQFPKDKLPTDDKWAKELFDGQHFPLRIAQLDDRGKVESRMEVKSVDPKKLDDELFSVPKGYRKVSMGDMMKGMGLAELGQGKTNPAPGNIPSEVRDLIRGAQTKGGGKEGASEKSEQAAPNKKEAAE